MTKNIKFSFLAFILLLSATSCNKWLELKPQDGIIREDFWKTKEQLRSAVFGAYSSLLAVPEKRPGLMQNMLVWGELRADMMGIGSSFTNNDMDYKNNEILPNSVYSNWATLYNTINVCNTVIEFGPTVRDNDKTISEAEVNEYLAEAYGLRAYMYFYLLRLWGEVPLQLKASSSDSKIEQLAKSSKEVIYNQIVSDLDFAARNIAENYGSNDQNKGRLTVYGIYALQADVYLWGENYTECIAACKRIEDSGKFGLIEGTDPELWFRELYITGNSNESIFEIQFDRDSQNPWFSLLAAIPNRYAATFYMDDFFGITDPTTPTIRDIRSNGASYNQALSGMLWKHVGTNYGSNTAVLNGNSDHNWIVYRYADILLMKAEALAWTGDGVKALELVDIIRNRSTPIFNGTVETVDPGIPYQVSDYILKERAREFAFEGKRWFDLLRHAKRKGYERGAQVIVDAVSKVAPPDRAEVILNKFKDYRNHYLPIATSELLADKNLVQNPYYKTN
ncbi:MAG: RagB/SusD family nutrient uptake outer membrane protein [Sphingobacteriaceae bacterium]|nr:RagB/SusD family nutrient uptake outer membrane protein [Sphingobacteriaceae bacterium]